jgi:undecaprenyl-diphosphatase
MHARLLDLSARLLRRVRREPLVTFALLVVAGSLWVFLTVAGGVRAQQSHELDSAILLAMRVPGDPAEPVGPARLKEAARDITALGGITVLTCLTAAIAVLVLLLGKPRLALLIVAAVLGGALLSSSLKRGFDRPRPDLISHQAEVMSESFPSGHSMMAAVVYLTLGLLLARALPGRAVKVYLVSLSVLVAVCIGASRVYLGVHWPTDVVAGWVLGAAWALLFWLIALRVDPRRGPAG